MAKEPDIEREAASGGREPKRPPRRWFPLWTLDGYILREFFVK